MAWFLEFKWHGKDAYPLLREKFKDPEVYSKPDAHWAGADIVRAEIFKAFGYFNTESSQHMSEYVPYFRKSQSDISKFMSYTWNALEITRQKGKDDDLSIQRQIQGEEPIELKPSVEYGAQIINAVVTNEVIRINGNVRNSGLITNLPGDCCVEVPCLVDRNGINPCYVGGIPPQLAALNRMNINVQSLIVEAALKRNKEAACRGVMLDPLTSSLLTLDDIRKMVHEMFDAESRWLVKME
jgi:alpha-galactosidase